jgi:hypothetical protein
MVGGSIEGLNQPASPLDDGSIGSNPSIRASVANADLWWAWLMLALGLPLLGFGVASSQAIAYRLAALGAGFAIFGYGIYSIAWSIRNYGRMKESALEDDLGVG